MAGALAWPSSGWTKPWTSSPNSGWSTWWGCTQGTARPWSVPRTWGVKDHKLKKKNFQIWSLENSFGRKTVVDPGKPHSDWQIPDRYQFLFVAGMVHETKRRRILRGEIIRQREHITQPYVKFLWNQHSEIKLVRFQEIWCLMKIERKVSSSKLNSTFRL